jgi:hypothetical protein
MEGLTEDIGVPVEIGTMHFRTSGIQIRSLRTVCLKNGKAVHVLN